MGRKGVLKEEFVTKKGEEDVPVDPCSGWIENCDFCNKRFGDWVESGDQVLEKIPSEPGLFMVALKTKGTIEVRNLFLCEADLQKGAYNCVDAEKDLIADKKSKATKSVILCRWMNFKSRSDKNVVNLCAHWYNSEIKPRNMDQWPGLDLIRQSGYLVFSEKIQKWCYPKKEATWRKPKPTLSMKVETVMECDFEQPCGVCDSNFGFSSWRPLDDVIRDDMVPKRPGIYQLAVKFGKKREVVLVAFDHKDIIFGNLRLAINPCDTFRLNYLYREKYLDKNATLEVRWLELQNADNENSCFLWAHWLNAHRFPILNRTMQALEKKLEKHKSFVLRVNDKKWCYEIDVFKQNRLSKFVSKKQMKNELIEDIKFMHRSE